MSPSLDTRKVTKNCFHLVCFYLDSSDGHLPQVLLNLLLIAVLTRVY